MSGVKAMSRLLPGEEVADFLKPPHNIYRHSDLAVWLPINDNSTSTLIDASGNGHDCTLSNIDAGDWAVTGLGKGTGLGLALDGVDQYGTISDHADLKTANFTWAAWVQRETVTTYKAIAAKSAASGNWVTSTGRGMAFSTTKTECWGNSYGGNEDSIAISGLTSSPTADHTIDTWMHVGMTHDGTVLRLYWNGVTNGVEQTVTLEDGGDLKIGFHFTGFGYLNGKIFDFRIYNVAFSDAEMGYLARNHAGGEGPVGDFER